MASNGLKIVVSLTAVPLLLSFKNIWFRKEVSVPLDNRKDENGKSLNEEGEDEDDDNDHAEGQMFYFVFVFSCSSSNTLPHCSSVHEL